MDEELKNFPYTNPNFSRGCCCPSLPVHQINLDWVLDKMKEAAQAVENAETAVREAQQAVDSSAEDAATSKENATHALNSAAEALVTANEAINKANRSGEIASGAFAQANEAVTKADNAVEAASRAATDSDLALQFAREAVANSATTLEKAENAETVANGVDAKAEEAKTLANRAGELAANSFYQSQQAINKADDADIKAGKAGDLAANAFYRAEQAEAKAEQALAQGGGGGGGATPNWNANEGEAGYIENRTHYPYIETVFDGVVEFNDDLNTFPLPVLNLSVNAEYHISMHGAEYVAVCKKTMIDGLEVFYLGNLGLFGGEDSGEAFLVVEIPSAGLCGALANNRETTNIYIGKQKFKRLFYEYLPQTFVVKVPNDAFETFGNTKIAHVNMDTSGLLEAVKSGLTMYLSLNDGARLAPAISLQFNENIGSIATSKDKIRFGLFALDVEEGLKTLIVLVNES